MKALDKNHRILQHIVSAIPWRQINAMRNIVAHSYGSVDPASTWEIVIHDIPTLRQFCQSILDSEA